jgi:hypothetical protein
MGSTQTSMSNAGSIDSPPYGGIFLAVVTSTEKWTISCARPACLGAQLVAAGDEDEFIGPRAQFVDDIGDEIVEIACVPNEPSLMFMIWSSSPPSVAPSDQGTVEA